jgi:hypothetical protein
VGGVPIERVPVPVVAHRRSGVCVAGTVLDVVQRDAGVEGRGDEGVAETMRVHLGLDPGLFADARDRLSCVGPVIGVPAPLIRIGPDVRSPIAASSARAVFGDSGNV